MDGRGLDDGFIMVVGSKILVQSAKRRLYRRNGVGDIRHFYSTIPYRGSFHLTYPQITHCGCFCSFSASTL